MHTGTVLEGLVLAFWGAAQRRREGSHACSHVANLKRMCGLADFIFKKSDRPLLAWISFGVKLCRSLIVINGVVKKHHFFDPRVQSVFPIQSSIFF
jgi:hypothetical protein